MNAIVPTTSTLGYGEIERLAVSIAKSGLFGMKTPEQAMALMMIAVAEGRHPALAARDYDVIQGRPAKKAEAMLRDFLSGGGKVEWTTLTDDTADATFSHPQGGTVRIVWDTDRAALAGLATKENWKKYPRQMLRSRVVSEGVRTVWPMATSGMYEVGEIGDMKPANDTEHNGPTIEAEPPPSRRDQVNAEVPLRAAAAATPRGATVREPTNGHTGTRTDEQWRAWLDKLRAACEVLYRRDEVVEIGNRPSVGDAIASGPEWVRAEISRILAENYARFGSDEDQGDLPEVEIAGEEKMGAG